LISPQAAQHFVTSRMQCRLRGCFRFWRFRQVLELRKNFLK
jgi:hypothetical protein